MSASFSSTTASRYNIFGFGGRSCFVSGDSEIHLIPRGWRSKAALRGSNYITYCLNHYMVPLLENVYPIKRIHQLRAISLSAEYFPNYTTTGYYK